MLLPTNTHGLPLPGRELDVWICREILGLNVVHEAWPCGYSEDSCGLEAAAFVTKDDEHYPIGLPSENGAWEYFMESRGIGDLVGGKWVWKAKHDAE